MLMLSSRKGYERLVHRAWARQVGGIGSQTNTCDSRFLFLGKSVWVLVRSALQFLDVMELFRMTTFEFVSPS